VPVRNCSPYAKSPVPSNIKIKKRLSLLLEKKSETQNPHTRNKSTIISDTNFNDLKFYPFGQSRTSNRYEGTEEKNLEENLICTPTSSESNNNKSQIIEKNIQRYFQQEIDHHLTDSFEVSKTAKKNSKIKFPKITTRIYDSGFKKKKRNLSVL